MTGRTLRHDYYEKLTIAFNEVNPWRDIAVALLAEVGFESFLEEENTLMAFIQGDAFDREETMAALFKIPVEAISKLDFEAVDQRNWNEEWEASFEPIDVDGFCRIRAPFHQPKFDMDEVVIEPKMSFGTGHHATTYLMVRHLYGLDLEAKTVLDMGCGTGVLAIVAKKRGASDVTGIDIESWAVENAIENAERNDCSQIRMMEGDITSTAGLRFDIILANINRNVLLTDMPAYAALIPPGGVLLLSGFFPSDTETLISKAAESDLEPYASDEKDGWAFLHLRKRTNHL
jgi:ribosomal protein L11 methyltransferase